jgi:hypothetical protein
VRIICVRKIVIKALKVVAIHLGFTSRASSVMDLIWQWILVLYLNVPLVQIGFHRSILNALKGVYAKVFESKQKFDDRVIKIQMECLGHVHLRQHNAAFLKVQAGLLG